MDIRVLRYFLAVCKEGNLSRAAQTLHVTQPTLSRQIGDLERELGCTLLVRGNRSITLTEKGRYLRRRAEEIITLADQTASELTHNNEVVEGEVFIGAGESEGIREIAKHIRVFRQRYPHVQFHVRSGNSTDVLEWLERGLIDFAVLMSYPDINRFEHIRLHASDAWGALMPEDHPLVQKETIAPHDLADEVLIVSNQALETGELSHWFGSLKEHLNIAATYNLAFNAAQLVHEGVGCALTLDKLVATGADTGLAFRLLYPPVVSVIDFAWKDRQSLSHAANLFLDEIN